MTWTADTELKRVDDTTYKAFIGEHWSALHGAHGGIVAALAVRAAQETLKSDATQPEVTLRAATFGYASSNSVGEILLTVEVLRRGRQLSTVHVMASQSNKTTTFARMHFSTAQKSIEFSDVPAAPNRPASTYRIEPTHVKHFVNADVNVDEATRAFANSTRGEWRAWCRPNEGGTFDAAWLTMLGDYFPPAVFARQAEASRAVTIEYSIQIHDGANKWALEDDEYVSSHIHVSHSHDGYALEDGWLWLPNNQLLATVRQTRLAG